MSQAKKLAAGIAAVVVVAVGASLPGITGYILENNLQERLELTAEKYNFSVSSIEIDRSFSETTIEVVLEGNGVRKLSQESLKLEGSMKHANIFALPDMLTADLNFTYYLYQQGVKFGLPGSVQGSAGWNGSIDASITTDPLQLPLDPAGSAAMIFAPMSAQLSIAGKGENRKVNLDMNRLNWSIQENNQALMTVEVEPSELTVSQDGEQWSMSIPALTLSAEDNGPEADLTLANIEMSGEQKTENNMLSSRVTLSTGQLTVPALAVMKADKVIEGFTMTSSFENISDSSIDQLAVLMEEINLLDNDEEVEKAAREFLVTLSENNPHVALDEFTLKTANGDLGLSFDVEGTEKAEEILKTIIASKGLSLEQEKGLSYELLTSINSSAKVQLSDDLVSWSCDRMGEQAAANQGASDAEGQFIAGMCKTMANSGEFLSVPCMEVTDSDQQAQCMDTMEQVKKVWASNKSLELALKDGKLQLNGAELELPKTL